MGRFNPRDLECEKYDCWYQGNLDRASEYSGAESVVNNDDDDFPNRGTNGSYPEIYRLCDVCLSNSSANGVCDACERRTAGTQLYIQTVGQVCRACIDNFAGRQREDIPKWLSIWLECDWAARCYCEFESEENDRLFPGVEVKGERYSHIENTNPDLIAWVKKNLSAREARMSRKRKRRDTDEEEVMRRFNIKRKYGAQKLVARFGRDILTWSNEKLIDELLGIVEDCEDVHSCDGDTSSDNMSDTEGVAK